MILSSASLTHGYGIIAVTFIALSLLISLLDAISISHGSSYNSNYNNNNNLYRSSERQDNDYSGSRELLSSSSSSLSFPLIYKWSKRNPKSERGCSDPTEPFQCPGSNICISLQFLCDGHANDCPNNYDEDQSLCVSAKRPPKHTIMTLLSAQVNNHGTKFIEYMFGKKALALFDAVPHMEAINIITIALSVSPTIDDFAKVIEMTHEEKKRLASVLESLNNGRVHGLPTFIVDSAGEGMSTLAHHLIKTNFLSVD